MLCRRIPWRVTRNQICAVTKDKLTFTDKGKLRTAKGYDALSTLATALLAAGEPVPAYWENHIKDAAGRLVDNERLWEGAAEAALSAV
jgi:hypothetical protein